MLADHPLLKRRAIQYCLLLFIVVLICLTGWRVYRGWSEPATVFNWDAVGHSDFHNGTYFPTLAFRNGDNPYSADVCEKYIVPRSAPPFSPWVFISHLPISFLELHVADVVFFVFNVLLILGLGALAIQFPDSKWRPGLFALVAVLLLISRPGHLTLFTGYFTAELAIGTALALHFARSKPWLAGVGLLLASGKPNFIIPLMILMVCRRDFRAVIWGFALCAIAAVGGFLWLASFSSPGEIIEGFKEGQAALEEDPTETPLFSWTRTDLPGLACKIARTNPGAGFYFMCMLPLLVIPGLAVNRLGKRDYDYGASGLSGSIIAISILLSIYHQSYDCLILVVPWIGVTFFGSRVLSELGSFWRWSVALFTAVPAGNYLSTLSARGKLGLDAEGFIWQSITMINGICLLLALTILIVAAFRTNQNSSENQEMQRDIMST